MAMMHSGVGDTLQSNCLGGHVGQNKTQKKVTSRFYWDGVAKDVNFVARCDRCQKNNQQRLLKTHQVLKPVHVPTKTWSCIGIDLCGPLKHVAVNGEKDG